MYTLDEFLEEYECTENDVIIYEDRWDYVEHILDNYNVDECMKRYINVNELFEDYSTMGDVEELEDGRVIEYVG